MKKRIKGLLIAGGLITATALSSLVVSCGGDEKTETTSTTPGGNQNSSTGSQTTNSGILTTYDGEKVTLDGDLHTQVSNYFYVNDSWYPENKDKWTYTTSTGEKIDPFDSGEAFKLLNEEMRNDNDAGKGNGKDLSMIKYFGYGPENHTLFELRTPKKDNPSSIDNWAWIDYGSDYTQTLKNLKTDILFDVQDAEPLSLLNNIYPHKNEVFWQIKNVRIVNYYNGPGGTISSEYKLPFKSFYIWSDTDGPKAYNGTGVSREPLWIAGHNLDEN